MASSLTFSPLLRPAPSLSHSPVGASVLLNIYDFIFADSAIDEQLLFEFEEPFSRCATYRASCRNDLYYIIQLRNYLENELSYAHECLSHVLYPKKLFNILFKYLKQLGVAV